MLPQIFAPAKVARPPNMRRRYKIKIPVTTIFFSLCRSAHLILKKQKTLTLFVFRLLPTIFLQLVISIDDGE